MKINNNRLIVVLGMHRSGTSAITRGLQVLGVSLGSRLLPPQGDNTKGFWEDIDINALNIEMLSAIDSDWHHLAPVEPSDIGTLCDKGYFDRAVKLLRQRMDGVPVFGFKDPRVAKLLPFWKEVFSHCQFNVSYVMALRHPLSVARSLAKRNGIDSEKSYLLWLGHVIACFLDVYDDKRVVVDYDRLIQSPDHELNRIAEYLDLDVEPIELEIYKSEFLDHELRHSVYELNDLLLEDNCPPIIHEVYAALLDIATDKAKFYGAELQKEVINWINEFERGKPSMKLIDRLFEQKVELNVQINNLNHAVSEREGQIDNLNQATLEVKRQIDHLNQVVSERERQIDNLNQVVSEYEGQIENLNQTTLERERQIDNLNQVVSECEGQIENHNQAMAERDAQIARLDHAVAERDRHIAELYNSNSWRITQPLRIVVFQMKRINRVAKLTMHAFERGGGFKNTFKKATHLYRREGWAGINRGYRLVATSRQTIPPSGADEFDRNNYAEWIRRYDTLTNDTRAAMRARIEAFSQKPLISVVMPTYNTKAQWLTEAVESVRNQIYPYWELCIADDASTDKTIRHLLERYAKEDARIKIMFRKKNGHISAASNSALTMASGQWVALLDHDDLLTEHALFWVADAINHNPEAGLIYSDEDKIDTTGKRYDPYFKCEHNSELLLAQNMVCHLSVYKLDLLKTLEGFRTGFEGAQDYDLALRAVEQLSPGNITHIPHVLYHWRAIPGSTALAADEKNYAADAGRVAVAEHLKRRGISAYVTSAPEAPALNRVKFALPNPVPLVSVIIPTRDHVDMLSTCVHSILKLTTYPAFEIIIIDNGSVETATAEFFASLPIDCVKVIRDDSPFNFSALNNHGSHAACGELLCLMNNDIEILTPDWLEEMVSFAMQPEVGCVGARLWYPDGRLQHGGVIIGVGGVAGHSHKYVQRGNTGYFGRAVLHQSLSAVTAACLVVRRTVFDEVNGFDEVLAIAFNDIDFCLRIQAAGYRNVWTPYAEMIHHESVSRGYEDTPEKQARFAKEVHKMQARWGEKLMLDPAYSPNLSLDYEDFSLAWPPRVDSVGFRRAQQ